MFWFTLILSKFITCYSFWKVLKFSFEMNLENTTDEFSKELFSEECPFEFSLAVHELKMSKPFIFFGKNKYLNIYFHSVWSHFLRFIGLKQFKIKLIFNHICRFKYVSVSFFRVLESFFRPNHSRKLTKKLAWCWCYQSNVCQKICTSIRLLACQANNRFVSLNFPFKCFHCLTDYT
jgi:hypothetical protein